MAVITNNFPYYDDYDPQDNYQRILFKPGVAVQARELTQLQSILQNQIETLGNYVVDDGVVLQGANFIENYNARSIRISNTTPLTSAIVNKYVRGITSNVVGKVVQFIAADSGTIGDPQTLIINWTGQGNAGRSKLGIFNQNEVLYFYNTENAAACTTITATATTANTAANVTYTSTCSIPKYSKTVTLSSATTDILAGDYVNHPSLIIANGDTGLYVSKVVSSTELELNKPSPVEITVSSGVVSFVRENTQLPLYVHVNPGVFYKNGFFIQSPSANVIVDKYNQTPYKSVGINLEFINTGYEDDPALLDPAIGSTNYFAPGADRLKANVEYVTVSLGTDNQPNRGLYDNFIGVKTYLGDKFNLINRQNVDNPLAKTLAERTYLESGNYNVEDLNLVTPSSFNVNDANVEYSTVGGIYYVGGNLVKVPAQVVKIRKGRDTKLASASQIGTRFGNYTLVEDFSKSQLNPGNVDIYANVEIHGDFTMTNRIGTATLKAVEFDSVKSSASTKVYRLYFHRINMETNTFANARSFTANVSGTSYFRCNVNSQALSLSGVDGTLLYDSANQKGFFGLLNKRISGVDPNTLDYYYRTTIKNQTFTSGNAVINLTGNETWVGDVAPSAIPGAVLNTNYAMTVTTAGSSTNLGQYALTPVKVRLNSSTQLEIGTQDSGFNGTADILVTKRVRGSLSAVNYRTKTLTTGTALLDFTRAGNIGNTLVTLGRSDVYKILYANTIPSNNTHGGVWTSGTTYYKGNVVAYNNTGYYCNVTTTIDTSFPTANFSPLGADTLSLYVLDNGQRDSFYDHGGVSNTTSKANVFVIFNYFEHTGTGPIVANSYLNAGLTYSSIPIHKTDAGNYVALSDVIDFRPRRENSSSRHFDATTRNYRFNMQPAITPANIDEYTLSTDYNYYLPRRDVIVLDKKGRIFIKEGVSSLSAPAPILNLNDTEEIVLGYTTVAPYTMNRNEISINLVPRKRYTMRDIADLDARIGNLQVIISNLIKVINNQSFNTITDDNNSLYTVLSTVTESFGAPSGTTDLDKTKGTYDSSRGAIGSTVQSDSITFKLDTTSLPSQIVETSNTISMAYSQESMIKFVDASTDGPVVINPFELTSLQGRVTITPKGTSSVNRVLTNAYSPVESAVLIPASATVSYDNIEFGISGSSTTVDDVKTTYSSSSDAVAYRQALEDATRTVYGNSNNKIRNIATGITDLWITSENL